MPVGQSCLGRIYKGLRQALIWDFTTSIRIDRYVLWCMILQLCQSKQSMECVFDACVCLCICVCVCGVCVCCVCVCVCEHSTRRLSERDIKPKEAHVNCRFLTSNPLILDHPKIRSGEAYTVHRFIQKKRLHQCLPCKKLSYFIQTESTEWCRVQYVCVCQSWCYWAGQYLDTRPPGKLGYCWKRLLVRSAGGVHPTVCDGDTIPVKSTVLRIRR